MAADVGPSGRSDGSKPDGARDRPAAAARGLPHLGRGSAIREPLEPELNMATPHDDAPRPPEPERINTAADDPLGMVPAAGKHAARPSEAERRESMHQTDAPGTRREDEPTGRDPGA